MRQIPKMDRLLDDPIIRQSAIHLPRTLVRSTLQNALEELRQDLRNGCPMPEDLTILLAEKIRKAGCSHLRRVLNGTGIILHTNLGRAPLGENISAQVAALACGYSNLELDLDTGKRGSRNSHVEKLLCDLTGAESVLVVNNNASSVFLMLHTMAQEKKVAISRGELVEIGGSFRIPDIMRESRAELMEIGTTNKTHLYDYERAVSEGAQLLLKVHPSNFHISGFTEEVTIPELSQLAEKAGIPLLYDLGSAFLVEEEKAGPSSGSSVRQAVAASDVVCFSGDKLLGGGQCGILLGKRRWIDAMKKDPFSRILRVDKMTLSALEQILKLFQDPENARREIPVLRMLYTSTNELKERATSLQQRLQARIPGADFFLVPCNDEMGGGSLPDLGLEGWAVGIFSENLSPDILAQKLRSLDVPILGRICRDQFFLSLRTILPGEEDLLIEGIASIFSQSARSLS